MREGVSAPFVAPRANGSSFGASEHASCVTCATWATGSAGTKRSSGERRREVAGGARERGTCAKRGAPCSLLRERAAGPWGRANATPSPFARPGRRGDRDEAERRRAVRRGSRRSEGGCFSTSATCPHARLCSPPTARARGHAAAAVLRLLKRPDYPRTPRPPRLPVARVAALALISIPRSSPLAFFSQTRHGGSPRLLIRLPRPCPSAAAASFSAGAKDRDLEHAGDALSDAAPSGLAY